MVISCLASSSKVLSKLLACLWWLRVNKINAGGPVILSTKIEACPGRCASHPRTGGWRAFSFAMGEPVSVASAVDSAFC